MTGTASDPNTVTKLEAAFDTGTGTPSFHDITTKLVNGSYTLTAADLATLHGSALPDGQYTLLVRATDAAGNPSQNATLTFTLDTTIAPPTVKLVSDTGVSTTDGLTSNDSVTGSASDLHTVTKLEAAFDTGTGSPSFHDHTPQLGNGIYTLTATHLATLSGSALPDGKYKLLVRATDAAGNLSQNVALTFTLDTTIAPPTMKLVNDTGVSKIDGLTSNDSVTGTASDPNTVTKLEAAFDTGTGSPSFHDITTKLVNGSYTLTAADLTTLHGSALPDGQYKLLVRATDLAAGNLSQNATLTFTLDTTIALPTVKLLRAIRVSARPTG